jgi:hypothetical protein
MGQRGKTLAISLKAIDPIFTPQKSGRFVWSAVVVVNGEQLTRVTHGNSGRQYELFKVQNAAEKWLEVEQYAEAFLPGAFAPLDELIGMLFADAMDKNSVQPDPSRDLNIPLTGTTCSDIKLTGDAIASNDARTQSPSYVIKQTGSGFLGPLESRDAPIPATSAQTRIVLCRSPPPRQYRRK